MLFKRKDDTTLFHPQSLLTMYFMSEKTFSLDHKHWVEGLYRGGEMAQHLRALAAPAEESNSDPSIHIWQRKTACNSSSRGLSKCPIQAFVERGHEHGTICTCRQTLVHIKMNKYLKRSIMLLGSNHF